MTPFDPDTMTNHYQQFDPEEAMEKSKVQAKQRSIERAIRATKKRINAAEALGDKESFNKYRMRRNAQQAKMREFLKENDWLKRNRDREQVFASKQPETHKATAPTNHTKPNNGKLTPEHIKSMMNNIDLEKDKHSELIKLGEQVNKLHNVADVVGKPEELKSIFSNYREMGASINDDKWFTGSNKNVKTRLQSAFSDYPKDWGDRVNRSDRKFFAGKTRRGFFQKALVNTNNRYLSKAIVTGSDGKRRPMSGISIYSSGEGGLSTEWHEIGHLVEAFNPNVLKQSLAWVAKRTEGEKLSLLRDIFKDDRYRYDEKTKKDNFISPYIGKDYGDNASEVLSVGLQSLYTGESVFTGYDDKGEKVYKSIADDPEFMNLIIGMILKG